MTVRRRCHEPVARAMRRALRRAGALVGAITLCAMALAAPAAAQSTTAPDATLSPAIPAPTLPQILPPQPSRQPNPVVPRLTFPGLPQPQRPQNATPPAPDPGVPLRLSALYSEGGETINRGVTWRIFLEQASAPGGLRLVTTSNDAAASFRLPAGNYVINASYGRASLTKRVVIGTAAVQDGFVLNAGGLRLGGTVGERRIPDSRLSFSIFTGPGPGGVIVVDNVRPNRILRLPVGDYYVTSKYGDANAIMSGDVHVQAGRLSDVTLHHRAAQITLKLVSEKGGEAIANTAWSVLTPGGDAVQEAIGAFPSMVLAAGEYTVIARYEGHIFSDKFTVDSGLDREVEVLAR